MELVKVREARLDTMVIEICKIKNIRNWTAMCLRFWGLEYLRFEAVKSHIG